MIFSGIEIAVCRKAVRCLRLTVRLSDGSVRLTVPSAATEQEIKRFLTSKQKWLISKVSQAGQQPPTAPRTYSDGETVPLWGVCYPLRVISSPGRQSVALIDGQLVITARADATRETRERLLDAWYRKELYHAIAPLLERWQRVMGLRVQEIRVKDMRTRWGTCNPRDRRVWISLQLVKHAPEGLEYVLVHELSHLLVHAHNAAFYALLDQYLPDWRARKDRLNRGL